MPTRSALILLFALLVAVPVGAAIYLGRAGLERERAMLVEGERKAMEARADAGRDVLVRELQALWRAETARPVRDYAGGPPLEDNREHEARHDYFQVGADGSVTLPWGDASRVPGDVREFAGSASARLLLRTTAPLEATVEARESEGATVSHFSFVGDLAVRQVVTANGERLLQGFRLDVERLERTFLDPLSPRSVVPRYDERVEQMSLVRDDARLGTPAGDSLGLPRTVYRHLVPASRTDDPVLLPAGYVLELSMHPAAALGRQLDAAEERLLLTLGAVSAVIVLGLLFAWRALRAEARLATRKAEFVSAVSHELRTPLTSIRMYADMLKEGWVRDETTAREYFSLIAAESERLARLVNNVLDFSRIEKGRKAFEMHVEDLLPVVRDVAEVLRPYLRERGFELDLALPERLPALRFDKDALTQVLVNLIDNAVKHGAGQVRLEAEAAGDVVCVRVLDRGPGVPPAERRRIFEPFYCGTGVNGSAGSGLGLALVHHYVRAHGGSIEVQDREGGGAAFTLRFPAAPAA